MLIAASNRNSLELLNLRTNSLETFIGKNGSSGHIYEGHKLNDVRLTYPYGIASDNESRIFFGEKNTTGMHLLVMTFTGDHVTSKHLSTQSFKPRYLCYDHMTGDLYLTIDHGLAVFHNGSETMRVVTGSADSGFGVGSLSTSEFYLPRGLTMIDSKTVIVMDLYNNR